MSVSLRPTSLPLSQLGRKAVFIFRNLHLALILRMEYSYRTYNSSPFRNLKKGQLGGVIFGCKHNTMSECLANHLFGLPAPHFAYVKNIDPGLPLFLFNYSDRKLYGIYKAVSSGQMNINPYAWTSRGSKTTQYSAQVQIELHLQCQPVHEDQFRHVIAENYYSNTHFQFELDKVQTKSLICILSASAVVPTTLEQQNTVEVEEGNKKDITGNDVQESTITGQNSNSSLPKCVEQSNNEIAVEPLDNPSAIAQLIREIEEMKAFKTEQIHKTDYMEAKLVQTEADIWLLKKRFTMLESLCHPKITNFDERANESISETPVDLDDWIYLVGGCNGTSYISSLDCYSPSHDVIKSLKPMNSARSYPSVVLLNSQMYVFGGVDVKSRNDTVEIYNPVKNEWEMGPYLTENKGSLAAGTVNGKIFAVGGGNSRGDTLSDVEMLDLDIGRWILTRSMLKQRYALAVAELNGALYAVGGYDGNDYLKSAERFDPREHSWAKIGSMNTKRSDHSLVVMNEKLYALGGHDGSKMLESVEIYDARLDSWMDADPMIQPRGFPAAVVLNSSVYALGGLKPNEDFIDTVECYEEGKGWRAVNARAVGRRGFFSAFVL